MNIQQQIREYQISIKRLEQLADDKKALLEKKYTGIETEYGIKNACLSTYDKKKLTDEYEKLISKARELELKLAALQVEASKQVKQLSYSEKLEIKKLSNETSKKFKNMTGLLYEAYEAAKDYEILRAREASLKYQVYGVSDYWLSSNKGIITSRVKKVIDALVSEIRMSTH